jgi:hypothetical protein
MTLIGEFLSLIREGCGKIIRYYRDLSSARKKGADEKSEPLMIKGFPEGIDLPSK